MQEQFNFEAPIKSPKTEEITSYCSKIGMPKACVSCAYFVHIGWEEDDHHPLLKSGIFRKSVLTTQVGVCKKQGGKQFGTEICPKYLAHPDVIPVEVENRAVPYGVKQ